MKDKVKPATDYSVNFNASIVSDDRKTGLALYGFSREREPFDANGDQFSEISSMENITIGSRFFHRFGHRSKLAIDFFNIKEDRAGGNRPGYPLLAREVAEAVKHDIKSGAITYDQFFREMDLLSVFASGQLLHRDSYYGANRSLSDYGNSKDFTSSIGIQYKAMLNNGTITGGVERTSGHLVDQKMAYPDLENAVIEDNKIIEIPHSDNTLVADQSLTTTGSFLQYELKFNTITALAGGRLDHYKVVDHAKNNEAKTGLVFSPRLSLMASLIKDLQLRASYSQGYRAPQIFDEDLHIETSGSRQVINMNDPDLEQETSSSYMLSLDYNRRIGSFNTSFLIEGFFTRLNNPFVNEIGTPDEHGTVYYTRKNAKAGAKVKGVNTELKLKPSSDFGITTGFTLQKSEFEEEQEFDEKRFFRTPEAYGFLTLDWDFAPRWCLSASGNYTGPMLVPYFGPQADPDHGVLRQSKPFFEAGSKISYTHNLNGTKMQWYVGMKNILNAYQDDFDSGIDRDPSYMYGPLSPRMIYFGIKIGNRL
jgi:outer membrane receptor for ferrienterochelin and colicins